MSRNSSRLKASRKTQGRLLPSYKNPDFFSGLSELYRIFSKMTEFMRVGGVFFQFCLFICCTEDHTCTVVNNGTCVLSTHTVNWRQRSFIRVLFVSASVLSIDRCYRSYRRTCHSREFRDTETTDCELRASIKPGTWIIPEHAGTVRNIPEHPGTWKNKNNFHENK